MRHVRRSFLLVVLGLEAAALAGCDDVARARHESAEHTAVRKRGRHPHDDPGDDEPSARGTRRVYAKSRFVWIRRSPDRDSDWLGYISLGESLQVRASPAPASDNGCPEWVPVEPEGWVCAGREATLDPNDELVVALEEHAAKRKSPWPYDYARSLGAPRYRGLPTDRDQRAREGDIDLLKKRIDQARLVKDADSIRSIDPRLAGAEIGMTGNAAPSLFVPPPNVFETDEDAALGATIAYSYEFDHLGRAWLLGWDHAVVPEVRVKKYPRSAFRGVTLDDATTLPVAFTQKRAAPKYARARDGSFVASKDAFAVQSPIDLAQAPAIAGADGKRFRETKEPGVFVAEGDVIIPAPIGEPPSKLPTSGRQTWVEVSTVGGWLVAYEARKPVYVTLVSAGRARALADGSMAPISSTPNGAYPIFSKLETTTMRSETKPELAHAEVMYTQVFFEGFALHGAYWHDEWGDRKSAGCVNLAPIDAAWLFEWSEPTMPPDWHARRTQPSDAATWVVVHL